MSRDAPTRAEAIPPGQTSARELARAFDETFAQPVGEREPVEELLAVRADDLQLALRARETAGIQRCPALTTVPSRNAALCGLAGVRGALVAVYDLAILLGRGRAPGESGWIVFCGSDRSAALLFDELAAYERVPTGTIHVAQQSAGGGAPLRETVRMAGAERAVISVPRLLESIRRKARTTDAAALLAPEEETTAQAVETPADTAEREESE